MYHMLLLYLFSLRKRVLSTTCAKYILTIPRFSYLAWTFSCLPDLYIHQHAWHIHIMYNSHLQLHMVQMELLIYPTSTPILLIVFLILVNDSIILPVAQARIVGVILVFFPFPHTPFLRFQSAPGVCPCLTTSSYPSGRIACLDVSGRAFE